MSAFVQALLGDDPQSGSSPIPGDPYWSQVIMLLDSAGGLGKDSSPLNWPMNGYGGIVFDALAPLGGRSTYKVVQASTQYIGFLTPANEATFGSLWALNEWTCELYIAATGANFTTGVFNLGYMSITVNPANNNISCNCGNISGSSYSFGGIAPTLFDGNFHHLAMVRDNSVAGTVSYLRCYFDGVALGAPNNSPSKTSPVVAGVVSLNRALGYADLSAHLAFLRMTKICRYPGGTTFTPPTVPYPAATVTPVNGTEALTGQRMTSAAGVLFPKDPWVKLAGSQVTASRGTPTAGVNIQNKTAALIGSALTISRGSVSSARYPNLINPSYSISGFTGYGVFDFKSDGTITVTGTSGLPYTLTWIDTTQTNYNITSIASQYYIVVVAGYGGWALNINTASDMSGTNRVTATNVTHASGLSITFSVMICPKTTNPRYGELGYYSYTSVAIST
jgi:hypothetical protein